MLSPHHTPPFHIQRLSSAIVSVTVHHEVELHQTDLDPLLRIPEEGQAEHAFTLLIDRRHPYSYASALQWTLLQLPRLAGAAFIVSTARQEALIHDTLRRMPPVQTCPVHVARTPDACIAWLSQQLSTRPHHFRV